MRFIHILFKDTTRQGGWIEKGNLENPDLNTHAVGIFIQEDEDSITIVQATSEDEHLCPLTIPKPCIVEMWDLEAK